MADDLEDDVLGDNHAEDADGAWLDIHLPSLVHQQLAAFGRRMGLTADGYAKLLIFQALHPLVAAEPSMADVPTEPLDDADVSREVWAIQLGQWAGREDEAPAPRHVHDAGRTFHADDFEWDATPKPTHQWAHVDSDGRLSVSQDLAPGAGASL
jgi:hypothetical protein